jgi:CPA2 family monovalent cation:H+ antiporter-2
MENILLIVFVALFLSTLFNIIFKKYGISHIIGYIVSGVIVSYSFNFNGQHFESLELIGEFGIVFLMFTIGLEMSFDKIKKLKTLLLTNGVTQVLMSMGVIFSMSYYLFQLDLQTSLIIALAFSLSSTAIVLTYLKESKDIVTPYGEKSLAILLLQDLAVIPILLIITFLTNDTLSLGEVLFQTFISVVLLVGFMFTIGVRIVKKLLKFSASISLEEVFLGAVFSIVLGSSILAHSMGFTYSLGAFIAGVIIAETGFNVKVESDIESFKDLLLGTFFFSVGTKIDIIYFLMHLHYIIGVFLLVFLFKTLTVYLIVRVQSDTNTSIKTALAIGNIGEFSFAIFALALSFNLIPLNIANFLILVVVASMILTPFIINNIYKISAYFEKEFYESDVITPIEKSKHTILVGFGTLGRVVAKELENNSIDFIIISDNLKHVLLARKRGYMAYFGHLDKKPVLESLKVDLAQTVIITASKSERKKLISEAVKAYNEMIQIIIKIDSTSERKIFRELDLHDFVDSNVEVSGAIIEKCLEKKVV